MDINTKHKTMKVLKECIREKYTWPNIAGKGDALLDIILKAQSIK